LISYNDNEEKKEINMKRFRKQNKCGFKWGFHDSNNKIILPPVYDYAENFSEGLAKVILNKKHGYIDKKGNMVIPPAYDGAGNFHEGFASVMVKLNEKYRFIFIDKKGNQYSEDQIQKLSL